MIYHYDSQDNYFLECKEKEISYIITSDKKGYITNGMQKNAQDNLR